MLVDPNTGMPIGPGVDPANFDPNSITAGMGISAAQHMGYQDGAALRMLEHFPSAFATTGWNAFRGSSTIIHGGYNPTRPGSQNIGNSFRQGIAGGGTNRKGWFRFASGTNIDPMTPTVGKAAYSPFNTLSWAANEIADARIKKGGLAGVAKELGIEPGEEKQVFSRGMLSRITASSKIGRMGDKFSDVHRGNIASFIGGTNDDLLQAGLRIGTLGQGSTALDNQRLVMASARSKGGQWLGGYLSGAGTGDFSLSQRMTLRESGGTAALRGAARAGEHLEGIGVKRGPDGRLTRTTSAFGGQAGDQVRFRDAWKNARQAFSGTADDAARHAAASRSGKAALSRLSTEKMAKLGAQNAGKYAAARAGAKGGLALIGGSLATGPAAPIVAAVGTAMLAYDLTQMAIAATVGAAETAKDGIRSMRGSINKPIMGMGYTDSTVAATSRARGVHAIANSRLNARSALGSESGMLAAHFG